MDESLGNQGPGYDARLRLELFDLLLDLTSIRLQVLLNVFSLHDVVF